MASIAISVLWMLVSVCIIVGLYYVVIWVLEQLGIPVPAMAVKICLLILGLLVLIWLISTLFGAGGGELGFPRVR